MAVSMKTKERNFGTDPFVDSICMGELFQRGKERYEKEHRGKRCSLSHDFSLASSLSLVFLLRLAPL